MNRTPRHIVITGASRGWAYDLRNHLLEKGDMVINIDIHKPLQTHENEVFFQCDLGCQQQVAATACKIAKLNPVIHGIVANAGLYQHQPIDSFQPDTWTQLAQLHVGAHAHLIHSLLPAMRQSHVAHIVLIASEQGHMGRPGGLAYGCSKAAVVHMARALAADLRHDNITANSISPASIKGSFMHKQAICSLAQEQNRPQDEIAKELDKQMPHGQLIDPQTVVNTALFLLEQPRCDINGTDIRLDAGISSTL